MWYENSNFLPVYLVIVGVFILGLTVLGRK